MRARRSKDDLRRGAGGRAAQQGSNGFSAAPQPQPRTAEVALAPVAAEPPVEALAVARLAEVVSEGVRLDEADLRVELGDAVLEGRAGEGPLEGGGEGEDGLGRVAAPVLDAAAAKGVTNAGQAAVSLRNVAR